VPLSDLVSVIMSTVDPLQDRTQRAIAHLARSTASYELILLSRNHEWTTGTIANQGIAASVGGYVAFCCDDCFVEPGALAAMKAALQDRTVGVAGALLLYPNGLVQHAGGWLTWSSAMGGEAIRLNLGHVGQHMPEPSKPFESRDVPFVTGALMMTRRDVFEQVGWYDPDCKLDAGDLDFCLRVRQAGYSVRFVAEARAVHLEGATRGSRPSDRKWFFGKWGMTLASPLTALAELEDDFVLVGGSQ